MLLSEASEAFLAVRRQEGFSRYTIKAYELQYRILIRDIGDLEIQHINLQLLRNHLSRNGHLKASSLGHKIRAIKSLFNWLFQEELLARNPTLKLIEPKSGKRIPKALTIEELELLRDACASTLEHALIEFFFATGCRVAEIQRLDRQDIDWHRGAVMVIGKGDKEREGKFTSARNAVSGCNGICKNDPIRREPCLSPRDARIECLFMRSNISSRELLAGANWKAR